MGHTIGRPFQGHPGPRVDPALAHTTPTVPTGPLLPMLIFMGAFLMESDRHNTLPVLRHEVAGLLSGESPQALENEIDIESFINDVHFADGVDSSWINGEEEEIAST